MTWFQRVNIVSNCVDSQGGYVRAHRLIYSAVVFFRFHFLNFRRFSFLSSFRFNIFRKQSIRRPFLVEIYLTSAAFIRFGSVILKLLIVGFLVF